MVKHVILWKLKEMDEKETESVKAGIKEGLEGLAGRICWIRPLPMRRRLRLMP